MYRLGGTQVYAQTFIPNMWSPWVKQAVGAISTVWHSDIVPPPPQTDAPLPVKYDSSLILWAYHGTLLSEFLPILSCLPTKIVMCTIQFFRPSYKLRDIKQYVSAEIEIIGFCTEQVKEYALKFMQDHTRLDQFISHASRKGIYDLLINPMILQVKKTKWSFDSRWNSNFSLLHWITYGKMPLS